VSKIVASATPVNLAKKSSNTGNTGSRTACKKEVTEEEHRVRQTARGDGL
jgi:hypothetical protein